MSAPGGPDGEVVGESIGGGQDGERPRFERQDDKQYEGLRKKGMSKERAAKIANSKGSSKRGGEDSSGGSKTQKQEAGRKGGKKSS